MRGLMAAMRSKLTIQLDLSMLLENAVQLYTDTPEEFIAKLQSFHGELKRIEKRENKEKRILLWP